MNKILRYSFIVLLAFIANVSFADTYTFTFTTNDIKAAGTTRLGGIDWTLTTGGGYYGYDSNKGEQFGSSSKPAKNLVLSTTDIPGTISSIKVNTSGGSKINATLEVKVGETTFGEKYTLTTTATEKEFTGSASGAVSLNFTQTSSKAIYIKSIEITTDNKIEYKGEDIAEAANIAAFKTLASGTKAKLTLKDAKVQYVNGTSDIYVVDATGGLDIYQAKDVTYTAGQILNGTITGTFVDYSNLPELTDITENKLTATDGTIEPIEMTVEEAAKAENVCKLVTVKDIKLVELASGDYKNYYSDEAKTLQIYDKFKLGYTPNTESAMNYTGILIPYNTQIELAPTVAPTTGINNITTDAASINAPAYNLAGQKVSASYKGVVIKAGKKYIQK